MAILGRMPPLVARWRGCVSRSGVSLEARVPWRTWSSSRVFSTALTVMEEPMKNVEWQERADGKLHERLMAALDEAGIQTLTEIQVKAIPAIRERNDILIASHTGSGKTYAYLLPIIERLKIEEGADDVISPLRAKRPRAIVLGPTRELTDQISQVAKSVSHHAKFCSTVLNGGSKIKTQRRSLAAHQDLVVATPSKLLDHHKAENVFLRDVHTLVLDEADTLFDHVSFPEVKRLVTMLQKKEGHCQFILVAATVTKGVRAAMKELFPDLHIVETSTLHKGVVGASHNFSILKPGQDKIHLLRDVLATDVKRTKKVMIFCNTLSSCRAIEHDLQENGVRTICYHGEVPKSERKDIIEQFSGIDHEGHILVCTDLAARGLDIPGRVDHIVNFDFPLTPVDYLHRSGRTARAGARGKVTSLVTGKDRVLADRIKWALEHDHPLDELTSVKRILPPSLRSQAKSNPKKQTEKGGSTKGLRGPKRLEMLQKKAQEHTKERKSRQQKRKMARTKHANRLAAITQQRRGKRSRSSRS